ncbi:MAG: glycosyltransferase family 4 protein, partial [Thermoguttaceae bacterium]|nr:glycosyltransferase family 4 protein [Thermoguttaceae bacterium]
MSLRRLVLVTRRFWPLVGGAERAMANLATELAARGLEVTVLTARWEPHWPAEIAYREVPVVRVPQASVRYWGTLQYMRAVRRWLRENPDRYDLVCVSMLKHSAYATLREVVGRVPVVLRAAGGGRSGDCIWQLEARMGARIKRRCMRADAFIAPSHTIQRELVAAGYPRARIHYLPNGVRIPPPVDDEAKRRARVALATANASLVLPDQAPLAVFTGRIDAAKGLAELVAAWRMVADRRRDARLWIVGDGPFESDLRRQIEAEDLSSRVVLTGIFDDVSDVLAAADLFVLPSHEEGMSQSLLEAMAAGLPTV